MSATVSDRLDALRGRVAVVSGGGSGIGEGLVRHAAAELDMTVAVVDVDLVRADSVASAIRDAGGRAVALQVDVADWASVRRMADRVATDLGTPALVVCNAGVEMTGLVWEIDPSRWKRLQGINVDGTFHLLRAFVPAMVAEEVPGHVLLTSSVGGISIGAHQSAYLVSKHAVRVLAQTLAADLEEVGADISVSILLPGAVRSRIFENAETTGSASAEAFRERLAAHLANDGLTPAQVARVAFDAVGGSRRWVHTHPELSREVLTAHVEDLLGGLRAT